MGINRLTIDGYASLELNRVTFPITGRVIADLPLNAAFNTATPAENGMILAVDYVGGKVNFPAGPSGDAILALHYSPEKEYDPNNTGLNTFKLTAEATNSRQYSAQGLRPRLGLLSVGEKFTTNAICYDTSDYTNNAGALAALTSCATTPVYGIASTSGAIQIHPTLAGTETIVLQVVKKTTMPNGDVGVQFVVTKAQ
jgi:hypothetical protein